MRYATQIRPISYLKANAAEVLQVLETDRKPMIITQNGEAKADIQDVASYEETQETLALLKILALGSQQVGCLSRSCCISPKMSHARSESRWQRITPTADAPWAIGAHATLPADVESFSR